MAHKSTHVRFYQDPTQVVEEFLAAPPQDRWLNFKAIELIGPANWAGLKKLEGRIPDEDLLVEACWAAKRNVLRAA